MAAQVAIRWTMSLHATRWRERQTRQVWGQTRVALWCRRREETTAGRAEKSWRPEDGSRDRWGAD